LRVYLSIGGSRNLLWAFGKNLGDEWNYGQATVPGNAIMNKNFSVVFEGNFSIIN